MSPLLKSSTYHQSVGSMDLLNRATVYFVDDEPDLLKVLCESAEVLGFEAVGYTCAKQLFDAGQEFPNGSIIVLDLNMPDMDGVEVMRKLVELPNSPSVILISGMDQGVLHSAAQLGRAHSLTVLDSLSKPIDFSRLNQLLLAHLGLSALHKGRAAELEAGDLPVTPQEVEHAITHNELVLHYQPKISLSSGAVTGVEALVRWQHPQRGLIYPDSFIPVAEEHGIIGDLTRWVLDAAVDQEDEWNRSGITTSIAVNISAIDITSLTLPERLTELLQQKKLRTDHLVLEITESALMGELTTSLDILTRMRLKGIRLSIDDFGTGYSSLSLLHRIPFTELKIDRSFVSQMVTDIEARAIVQTCITLAKSLNMKSVAEGVETEAQQRLLQEMGCDMGQGYFFAKPSPPSALSFSPWS